MSLPPITHQEVARLAAARRVLPARNYHASDHFVKWEDVIFALQNCYFVAPDRRPAHSTGFVAFGQASRTRSLRIDFNLSSDEEGALVLVVTAFEHIAG